MKKRIIGFVLTAAMVIGSLPFGAVNVYGDDILLLPENEITEDFGVSETGIGEISDVEPDAADADETDLTKTTDTADTTDASDTNDKEDDGLTDALNRKDTGTEEEGRLVVQVEQADPGAFDEEDEVRVELDISDELIQEGNFPGSATDDESKLYAEADNYVFGAGYRYKDAMNAVVNAANSWQGESSVKFNISAYGVKQNEMQNFLTVMINSHPEFFFLDGRVSYSYSLSDNTVTSGEFTVSPGYTRAHFDRLNEQVDRILAGVDPSWTDLQKVMYVHDYLILNINYDMTLTKHNMYQALVEGDCVCQGYALSCEYLLNRINSRFNCTIITSNDLNHAWNLVTLEGKDYYLDVTWDDPVKTYEYMCRYNYFLQSEAKMHSSDSHYSSDWLDCYGQTVLGKKNTDRRFENLPFVGMRTKVPMYGNSGVYIQYDQYNNYIHLYKYDFRTGSSTKIGDYDSQVYSYSVGLSEYGDFIVLTLAKRILVIGQDGKIYATYNSANTNGHICGAKIEGNTLYYDVESGNYIRYTLQLTMPVIRVPIRVTGITLSMEAASLMVGDTVSITATVTPQDADDTSFTFGSSDPGVAAVDGNGKITAIAAGETVITAKTTDGGLTASCRITVKAPVKVSELKVSMSEVALKPGDVIDPGWEVVPADADNKQVDYVSGDENTAVVDGKGRIKAVSVGRTTITGITEDGDHMAAVSVTVEALTAKQPVSNVASGNVEQGTRILLVSDTAGASVYYTLDGTDPSVNAKGQPSGSTMRYEDTIIINESTVLKAIAVRPGYTNSPVSEYRYRVAQGLSEADEEIKKYFDKISDVPEETWYLMGNDDVIYKAGSDTKLVYEYTGSKVTFNNDIRIYYGLERLTENRDYFVKYRNNIEVGDCSLADGPYIIVKGRGNYKGSAEFRFTIAPVDINRATVSSEIRTTVIAGTPLNGISPVIVYDGKQLEKGVDYDLTYYKGDAADGNEVDGSLPALSGDESYSIVVSAHAGSNYAGVMERSITVNVIDGDDPALVQMKGVKVDLPVLEWSADGVDIAGLFDNSNGRQSEARVYTDSSVLVYGTDFTVDEIENGEARVQLSAGEHTIVLRGTAATDGSCYVGEKNVTLDVKGIDASKVKVACFDTKPEYLGRTFTLQDLYFEDGSGYKEVTLYTEAGGKKTVLNAGDYSVDMSKARASGTFDVVFSFKNGYTGTKKMTVSVRPYNINKNKRNDVTVNVSDADYHKSGAVPSVTVTVAGVPLREGIDYSLTFKKNVKISDLPGNEPRVVIRGKGNYTGSVKKTFKVNKISISNAGLFVADKKYKADAGAGYFKSLPTVVDDNVTLKKKRDYNKFTLDDCTFCYAETGIPIKDTERVPAGTLIEVRVVVSCPETSQYKGSATLRGCYRLIPAEKNIKKAKVTVTDPDAFVFRNGQELIPAKATDLKVMLNSQIVPPSGYEIVSVKNNRFIGTATVIIEGRGDYGGMKKFTFSVKARKILAVLE